MDRSFKAAGAGDKDKDMLRNSADMSLGARGPQQQTLEELNKLKNATIGIDG
jgi:hypothetical protein